VDGWGDKLHGWVLSDKFDRLREVEPFCGMREADRRFGRGDFCEENGVRAGKMLYAILSCAVWVTDLSWRAIPWRANRENDFHCLQGMFLISRPCSEC